MADLKPTAKRNTSVEENILRDRTFFEALSSVDPQQQQSLNEVEGMCLFIQWSDILPAFQRPPRQSRLLILGLDYLFGPEGLNLREADTLIPTLLITRLKKAPPGIQHQLRHEPSNAQRRIGAAAFPLKYTRWPTRQS